MSKVILLITAVGLLQSVQCYNVSLNRMKRQSAFCNGDPLKLPCQTGGYCIESDQVCDGVENCPDGSDEQDTECRKMPCPAYLHRCNYGACVDADSKCNGVKNCRDNSDEANCPNLANKINTNCRSDEFECRNGQCIEMDARCNGREDCLDKSDETEDLCLNTDCPAYTYKCQYGACVDGDSRCNGVKDCADNSDEVNCKVTTTSTTTNRSPIPTRPSNRHCITPAFPDNGRWTYINNQNEAELPNVAVLPKTSILLKCNEGYKLSTTTEDGQFAYCTEEGRWSPAEWPLCLRLCRKRVNEDHAILECNLNGSKIPCDKATPGTRLTYRCDSYFEPANTWRVNICGENGEWASEKPKCTPICGEKRVSVEPLVIGGRNVIRGDYPWVVALYSNKNNRSHYENICGGSILSTSIVITAAHCVTIQDTGELHHHKFFIVAAGKYYNGYQDPRDNDTAQYSYINNITKHEWYKGLIQNFRYDIALLRLVTPFALSKVVQPVCLVRIDVNNPLLHSHSVVTVTGWGFTSSTGQPSEVLKVAELEYVDHTQCESEMDKSFAQQYFVEDKICAGLINKNTSVCRGDSGGGLVVQGPNSRYYLQGIVSLGEGDILKGTNERGCRSQRRALFTNVNYYNVPPNHWIETRMLELSNFG